MITVAIMINGHPLYARTAVRVRKDVYNVDDGSVIEHKYDDGAVLLAIKMLETIKEEGVKKR